MTLRSCLLALLLPALTAARLLAQQPVQPTDNLSARFEDGIVAIAEDKVITVDDVRRELSPLIPQIQREARNQEEFNQKLDQLQNDVIQQLIDKVLIIKEFRKHKDGEDEKHIPESFIDNRIADILSDQFDNDRSKFLAYLRSRGTTIREYRKETEEDIIYHYMRQQQQKSQSVVSPVRIEQFYKENKDQFYQDDQVHLRLIQLSHTSGETDAALTAKANVILARFNSGEKFEDLAKEFDDDLRRSKGGDWGWKKRTDLEPEYSEPLFALKKGQVTSPIVTKDGCYLLFAEDRKYAGIQPIDQVRVQIENILGNQMTQLGTEHWLERLRRNGYVKNF